MALPLPPGTQTPRPASAPPPPQAAPQPQMSEAPPPVRTESLPAEWMNGMQARPTYVVVCSIYPRALRSEPMAHGGRARVYYELPAGSLERPSYLKVYNTFTMAQNIYQDSDANQLSPKPIDARNFAQNDLVGY